MSYLNGKERIELLKVLNKLPKPVFQKLLTLIDLPEEFNAYDPATLLKWVESPNGCGLEKFLTVLDKIALVLSGLSGILPKKGIRMRHNTQFYADTHSLITDIKKHLGKPLPEFNKLPDSPRTSQYSFPSEKIHSGNSSSEGVAKDIFSREPGHSQYSFPLTKIHTNPQRSLKKLHRVDGQKGKVRRIQEIAKSYQQDLGDYASLDMVYVPGGSFWMGSPEEGTQNNKEEYPQHKVKVSALYMSKYPITQEQWYAVSLLDDVERALIPYPSHFKEDNLPVENVSWYDAIEFCQRLSRFSGKKYCLPSEAEWEYACRAGTTTPFYFGETIAADHANYNGLYVYGQGKKGVYREKTTPVDLFLPNSFGLHDMYGNIWEWCQDYWHENYINAPKNNLPWLQGGSPKYRVLRGGCWYGLPECCRSAFRFFSPPAYKDNIVGMRVVCKSF
ncbi:formylglycine-generating enzyme family protein [Leptothoe sp. LEGE 181152]|nr:formylglycine-generating enzyme family protein [Leptothoe sp. LEGE 181152]